jgi:hypothetical protein
MLKIWLVFIFLILFLSFVVYYIIAHGETVIAWCVLVVYCFFSLIGTWWLGNGGKWRK